MPEIDARPAPSAEAQLLIQAHQSACIAYGGYLCAINTADMGAQYEALSAYVAELEAEVARLWVAMDASWRKVVAYPFPQVCKHLVAANMLSDMERLGFAVTPEVADAIVNARDEEALAHPPIAAQRGRAAEGGNRV